MEEEISYELYFRGSEQELIEKIKKFCKIVGITVKKEIESFNCLSENAKDFFAEIYAKFAEFKVRNTKTHDITGEVLLYKLIREGARSTLSNKTLEYFISVRNVSFDVKFVFVMLRVSENEWYGYYETKSHEKIAYYLQILESLGLLYRSNIRTKEIKALAR